MQDRGHRRNQLRQLFFPRSRIHTKQTRIDKGRGERINAVSQTALFANILKQTRRHPAPQQGRIDLGRIVIRIIKSNRFKANENMGLIQRTVLAKIAACVTRVHPLGRLPSGQIAKVIFGKLHKVGMCNPPCSTENHGLRTITGQTVHQITPG